MKGLELMNNRLKKMREVLIKHRKPVVLAALSLIFASFMTCFLVLFETSSTSYYYSRSMITVDRALSASTNGEIKNYLNSKEYFGRVSETIKQKDSHAIFYAEQFSVDYIFTGSNPKAVFNYKSHSSENVSLVTISAIDVFKIKMNELGVDNKYLLAKTNGDTVFKDDNTQNTTLSIFTLLSFSLFSIVTLMCALSIDENRAKGEVKE